jgi:hypothetical protein
VIECCREVSRTSLRSVICGIGDGDFDIRDADGFLCVHGNPRCAQSGDTARRGSVWSDSHLFCRGYCLCSRGCRVWATHIKVYESSQSGIDVSHFRSTEKHKLFPASEHRAKVADDWPVAERALSPAASNPQ